MKLDLGSFAFGSSVSTGGNTPSWGTSLGQKKPDLKLTYPGCDNIVMGMIYKSIPVDKVFMPIGRGGHVCNSLEDNGIQLAALFDKVYINEIRVEAPFIMVIYQDSSESWAGRKTLKYNIKIEYRKGQNNNTICNSDFVKAATEALHLAYDACWVISDVYIINQEELHFVAGIVNPKESEVYPSAEIRKAAFLEAIKTTYEKNPDFAKKFALDAQNYAKGGKIELQSLSPYLSYLTALRTKPFMLLAGISGTGKSRIVRKLAQATVTEELQRAEGYIGMDFANDRWTLHAPANFELIQVKPNWHNSMDVIGYLSNIPSPHYVFTPFIEFIVKAWQHPEVPFFLCLDEMNLAPVEEYFAEFLSAIESRSFEGGEYLTDPIIKPFNSFGMTKGERGENINIGDMMTNMLFPNFKASDASSSVARVVEHFRTRGLTLPKNLIVVGTVNMDETTFSFSRKVLDRAMSVEMNEVDYDRFLTDTTDDDLKAIVKAFEENGDADLNTLLVDRHIEAREVISELGDDATFVINYLKRINALLEGTPFKLGYRAANEALIYLQASKEFGQADRLAALDSFTLMKILSRIEGDETKLKITDSEADKERIANAEVNVDEAKRYGDLNILTALRNIITQTLGELENDHAESSVTEEVATESGEEPAATERKKKELLCVKKIDSMLSQLRRDHFVSFWN